VLQVIATNHCVQRFRKRMRIRTPGLDAVAEQLTAALQDADFTRWPPPWVSTDRQTDLWALVDDIAFPLTMTSTPGRWLATTCLVRGMSS
jgi:DNA-directed RNA polymerase specialized sigma24 family protein